MLCRRTVMGLLAGLALGACGSAALRPAVRSGTGQIRDGGPRVVGAGDKFAGLVWTGQVNSVAARWRVPSIRPGSQPGRAATWIGAQGFAPDGTQPFIQIGTREELQPLGASHGPNATAKLVYEGFWTDVVRGLHPVSLFAVHPGDLVAAQMSLKGGRWTLTLADRSTGQRRRISTAQESAGPFRLALWLQEDATRTSTDRVFDYPDLSAVHLSSLAVDDRVPSPAALTSTWMALPHAYLGPTLPAADGFSVIPRRLSPAGATYLRIAGPLSAQLTRYLAEAARWRASTPRAVIDGATDRLIAAMAAGVGKLGAEPWPTAVAAQIRRLETADGAQLRALRRALAAGPTALLTAFAHGAGSAHTALMNAIRRGLGVRQTAY
jgi:hypothetical protein